MDTTTTNTRVDQDFIDRVELMRSFYRELWAARIALAPFLRSLADDPHRGTKDSQWAERYRKATTRLRLVTGQLTSRFHFLHSIASGRREGKNPARAAQLLDAYRRAIDEMKPAFKAQEEAASAHRLIQAQPKKMPQARGVAA